MDKLYPSEIPLTLKQLKKKKSQPIQTTSKVTCDMLSTVLITGKSCEGCEDLLVGAVVWG